MKIRKEITIGICVIIALCVLFFGIDFLKGINVFKPANYYTASYTNVNGLAVSAPVTINGYKIGLVRSIDYEYDNPGHVAVEFSLDKELKLPKGSKAVIVCDMLGTATVQLQLSDNAEFYNVGDKIESETASGLMDGLSTDIMPGVANIFPKVDSLLTSINKLASDPAIAASVKRLDAITANLEATMTALNKSVKALPSVMGNVEATTQNVSTITGNLAYVSEELKTVPLDSCMVSINRQLTIFANLPKN